MSASVPQAKHKAPIPDGVLWRAVKTLFLRDGTQLEVRRVLHVDRYDLVIMPAGADEPLLIPKHAVNSARLDRSRFARGGE